MSDWRDEEGFDDRFDTYMRRMDGLLSVLIEQGGFNSTQALRALSGDATESEIVSNWLRRELKRLRDGEKKIGEAPVLRGRALSRLTIADIAMSMVETSSTLGPELVGLLMELTNVDRHRAALAKKSSEKFEQAYWIEAQQPDIGVRELARAIGVAPSRISEWRRYPAYQDKVQFFRDVLSGDIEKKFIERLRKPRHKRQQI